MESLAQPLEKAPLKINHVVFTLVEEVKEIKGEWWVHFQGSRESLCFGNGAKPYEVGDNIKITFEKVP